MTEADWATCRDPGKMLDYLLAHGKASERKLRLYYYGRVREVWPLLTDSRSRRALEIAEAHADGFADWQELREAVEAADMAARRAGRAAQEARAATHAAGVAQLAVEREEARAATGDEGCDVERARRAARRALQRARQLASLAAARRGEQEAARAARLCVRSAWQRARLLPDRDLFLEQAANAAAEATGDLGQETQLRCDLLRDIYGPLPFRAVTVDPSWLRWNDGTVRRIAEGIYDERAFERMPVLSDALLDAGCDAEDLLAHCRGHGIHVRGCWAVDLLLAKE
jgi:hypothetical protein